MKVIFKACNIGRSSDWRHPHFDRPGQPALAAIDGLNPGADVVRAMQFVCFWRSFEVRAAYLVGETIRTRQGAIQEVAEHDADAASLAAVLWSLAGAEASLSRAAGRPGEWGAVLIMMLRDLAATLRWFARCARRCFYRRGNAEFLAHDAS